MKKLKDCRQLISRDNRDNRDQSCTPQSSFINVWPIYPLKSSRKARKIQQVGKGWLSITNRKPIFPQIMNHVFFNHFTDNVNIWFTLLKPDRRNSDIISISKQLI